MLIIMDEDKKIDEYISAVAGRLEANGFLLQSYVEFDGEVFPLVARADRFHPKLLTWVNTFFVFTTPRRQTVPWETTGVLEYLGWISFRYARFTRHSPMRDILLGHYQNFVCFPTIVVNGIDPAIERHMRTTSPPWHWLRGSEFPVVSDVSSRTLHYSRKTPMMPLFPGLWWYYRAFRAAADKMLAFP